MGAPAAWRLPAGIQEVLRGRLVGLPAGSVEVLTQAAVVGPEFDLEVLQAITGLEPPRLSGVLQEGVGAAVLLPAAGGTGRYGFIHGLPGYAPS